MQTWGQFVARTVLGRPARRHRGGPGRRRLRDRGVRHPLQRRVRRPGHRLGQGARPRAGDLPRPGDRPRRHLLERDPEGAGPGLPAGGDRHARRAAGQRRWPGRSPGTTPRRRAWSAATGTPPASSSRWPAAPRTPRATTGRPSRTTSRHPACSTSVGGQLGGLRRRQRAGVQGHRPRRVDSTCPSSSSSACSSSAASCRPSCRPWSAGIAVHGRLRRGPAITGVTDVSVFSINVITLLGMGLAIDYALFVVSRFREELARAAGRLQRQRARRRGPHDGHRRPHRALLRAHRRRVAGVAAASSRRTSCARWATAASPRCSWR